MISSISLAVTLAMFLAGGGAGTNPGKDEYEAYQ